MTIISHQKHVTNVSFAIFIREIFHAYFKYCNIWLNVLMDLSCIEAYNALLYISAGNKNKNTEDPDKNDIQAAMPFLYLHSHLSAKGKPPDHSGGFPDAWRLP